MESRYDHGTLALGASVYVLSPDDKLLLVEQRRGGRRMWIAPGGGLETGESMQDAARREAFEESGLRVSLGRVISIDELWNRGTLLGVDFSFLATPVVWPQQVTLPKFDGTTEFLGYRWVGRFELGVMDGLWQADLARTTWPDDINTPLARRVDLSEWIPADERSRND